MTASSDLDGARPHASILATDARTRARNAAERRFRACGIAALTIGAVALVVLLTSIVRNGLPAFTQTFVAFQVPLSEEQLDPDGTRDPAEIAKVTTLRYGKIIEAALVATLGEAGIETPIDAGDLDQIQVEALIRMLIAEYLSNAGLSDDTETVDAMATEAQQTAYRIAAE